MGRSSKYTKKLADEIVMRLANGEPLRQICRDEHIPSWCSVYRWIEDNKEFALRIARARQMGFDAIAEDALVIADTTEIGEVIIDGGSDGDVKTRKGDMLGHRKLKIDTRLKLLAKWDPKRYGDQITQRLVGDQGGPIRSETALTPSEAYLAMIDGGKRLPLAEPEKEAAKDE